MHRRRRCAGYADKGSLAACGLGAPFSALLQRLAMAPSKHPIQPDIRPHRERKPPDPMDGHDPITSAGPQIRSENEQRRAKPDPSAGSGVRVLCASEAGASRGLACMGLAHCNIHMPAGRNGARPHVLSGTAAPAAGARAAGWRPPAPAQTARRAGVVPRIDAALTAHKLLV